VRFLAAAEKLLTHSVQGLRSREIGFDNPNVRRSRSLRPPRDGLAVVERTAGIFRDAAKRPPPTIAEETDAFEQAVADEVVHGAGG
jgi:hypothetical protein